MIKLDEFKKYGFKVTWNAIYQGFRGNKVFLNQILAKDIIDHAIYLLECGEDNNLICEVAAEYEDDTEGIEKLLHSLFKNESSDTALEFKKLRVIYVAQNLTVKSENFIDGIMGLGDIWIELGYPDDSPHVFQGRNNSITPEQYFTQENYDKLYEAHKVWLNNEINYIIQNETLK